MIFANKEIARKFRDMATEDLIDFCMEVAVTGAKFYDIENIKHPNEMKESASLRYIVEEMLERTNNRLFKTLLYRSGMIFPTSSDTENRYYDIFLYYDNENATEFKVATAMREGGCMVGGIDIETGAIHT